MKQITEALREQAARLLQDGVSVFIGYEKGTGLAQARPVFVTRPEDVSALVFDPFCVPNLVKYLLRYADTPVAIVVKGCDYGAVAALVRERHLDRRKITVVGIPCGGMLERQQVIAGLPKGSVIEGVEDRGQAYVVFTAKKGEFVFEKKKSLQEKCLTCTQNNPVGTDIMVGKNVPPPVAEAEEVPLKRVIEVEGMSPEEKRAFWDKVFQQCIRCYACRRYVRRVAVCSVVLSRRCRVGNKELGG